MRSLSFDTPIGTVVQYVDGVRGTVTAKSPGLSRPLAVRVTSEVIPGRPVDVWHDGAEWLFIAIVPPRPAALVAWDEAVAEFKVAGACWHAWSLGAGPLDPMFAHRVMARYRALASYLPSKGFRQHGPSEVGCGL